MVDAYMKLHELGFAHSFEAWKDGELVGGLYGVSLGAAFFGESMFANAPDASKIAFVASVRQLDAWNIGLIDCQVHTDHLERFGAYEVPRARLPAAAHARARRADQARRVEVRARPRQFTATGGVMRRAS